MERGGSRETGEGRRERQRVGAACTAMQTPFGVSRSARSPAMHVRTERLDRAAAASPSSHGNEQQNVCCSGE